MSVTGLSPQEVNARLAQGEGIVAQGRQYLQQIQDTVTSMVGNTYRGHSANTLAQKFQATHDDCVPILSAMQQVLENAKHAAGVLTNLDAEV